MPRTAGGKRVRPWRHPLCKRLQQLGRSIKAPGGNNCLPDPAGAPTLQRFWRPFGVGKDSNLARASSSFDDRVRVRKRISPGRAGRGSVNNQEEGTRIVSTRKEARTAPKVPAPPESTSHGQSLRIEKPQPGVRSGRGLSQCVL